MTIEDKKLKHREHSRKWRENNRHKLTADARRESRKKYYLLNKISISNKKNEHRMLHPEDIKLASRLYYAKNSDHLRQKSRLYRLKNKEKYRQRDRLRYAAHRDKRLKAANEYRSKHRDSENARIREWRKLNPQAVKHHNCLSKFIRRSRMSRASLNTVGVPAFIKRVRGMKSLPCYYCEMLINGKDAHIDHVIAIAIGGNHEVSNLCASCPDCNLSKGAKPLSKFFPNGQSLLL